MRHLTEEELVDAAEAIDPEAAGSHLASCQRCAQAVAALRATIAEVAAVEVPEPSPLFWSHFSNRVHRAVAEEPAAGRSRWWSLPARVVWAGSVAVLAVGVGVLVSRPPTTVTMPSPTAGAIEAFGEPYGMADDPSLAIVSDLMSDLDWEGVREAGLTTHVGVDNDVMTQLNDGERQELRDLLRQALEHRGA